MQLRRFHGRTIGGALAQVRRALGPDALILETNPLRPGSAAARLNPGARYEICAVAERPAAPATAAPSAPPPPGRGLIEDLGLLRDQLRRLLDGDPADEARQTPPDLDLKDYHDLIEQGFDHRALAPLFRAWLDWRTAPPELRRYHAWNHPAGPAARMRGEGLREWLWWSWRASQGLLETPDDAPSAGPPLVGLIGPTGGGKTTALAKLASINRHHNRQNIVIATLDACRIGALDQWRRLGLLMGIEIQQIVNQEDLARCVETWDAMDWVGIDTPGTMTPDSEAGRLYGSILARCPHLETTVVLPLTHREPIGRRYLEAGRGLGARRVLFGKLDEVQQTGSMFNLTMEQEWKIDSFATGTRVPEDLEPATGESLWRRVLAPEAGGGVR